MVQRPGTRTKCPRNTPTSFNLAQKTKTIQALSVSILIETLPNHPKSMVPFFSAPLCCLLASINLQVRFLQYRSVFRWLCVVQISEEWDNAHGRWKLLLRFSTEKLGESGRHKLSPHLFIGIPLHGDNSVTGERRPPGANDWYTEPMGQDFVDSVVCGPATRMHPNYEHCNQNTTHASLSDVDTLVVKAD